MRLGIMQPYFFPYIGYFSLIKQVDQFIVLDQVQFIRHGWIERNRILKQSGGWSYISVPLEKHSRETLISEIRVNNTISWKEKILSQLTFYKKAPYYYVVRGLVEKCFQAEYKDIVSCDVATLRAVCEYLDIDTPIEVFSSMDLQIETPNSADEWALNICKSIPDVSEYWNPEGGIAFFDPNKYISNQIQIYFMKMNLLEYKQKGDRFESGLSILDVMMFNDPVEINYMMDNFCFIS